MRQKAHKMVSMFLVILILATMIIPSHATSIFPEGFIVGSVGDDNWAYKDTESYSAILSLRDEGDYLFTYAFRDADKSGSMTLSFDEIQNIDTILQELEEEARLLVIQSPQEMNLEGEPVVAEPLASNDSLFVNAIIALLRDKYDDEYDDYEVETRPGNGVMYRVRESLFFDGESTSLVKAIDSAFTAAQAASEIAAKFGVATPKALQFVLKTGKAVSSYAVLTEDMRVQRYRGVACYTRYGTAQSTGATEQYYESATKNILEYFLVDTVIHGGSSDAADYVEWSGAPSETIYIPSEYCFSETYLLDCAEDMH